MYKLSAISKDFGLRVNPYIFIKLGLPSKYFNDDRKKAVEKRMKILGIKGILSEKENTFEKVKSIVVEQVGVDEKEVKMDAAYIDDLGADSLDIVELIMAFEEEFNIEIPDDVAEKIKTVKDTVDYIEKEKKA